MTKPIKITRTLYVGLGGTGVKSILRTKKCFIDTYGEVPPMAAFLAIDTDKSCKDMKLIARDGSITSLTDNEICFIGITGPALPIFLHAPAKFQWLPPKNRDFLAKLCGHGASQVRSNGRFLVRYNANSISSIVASKVTEIGKPLPLGSPFVYDTDKDGLEYPTKVNIVGSIAGGTGSGTFLDVLVLVAKTLGESGRAYSITPWLVLPEVFRHMAPGPESANVFQNAYGALRELDYLYHLPIDNKNLLDFGFDKVYHMNEYVKETYLFNNTNAKGVVFQNIDDIADIIGRCMFLPSNVVDSVLDNAAAAGFAYDIKNKKAKYTSAGSAEIIYDNNEVGRVIARATIAQICNDLIQSSTAAAINSVNAWMQSESVAIQEHEADLLTDSILPKYAPFAVIIDKESDVSTINAYINSGAEASHITEEARKKTAEKLENVKKQLTIKINETLDNQNGVGAAKAFLESLIVNIDLCLGEMTEEKNALQTKLAYAVDWSAELSSCWKKIFGPIKIFDNERAIILQKKIIEHIADKRDLLRHNHAIQFYTDFQVSINNILQEIIVLEQNLRTVERRQMTEIARIQHSANSRSDTQVFLHAYDVNHFTTPNTSDVFALFMANNTVHDLIKKNVDEISTIMYGFASRLDSVVNATKKTVEQVLADMNEDDVRDLINRMKEMSSPLWSTNVRGYLTAAQTMTSQFIIGVCDNNNSIITKYEDQFQEGPNKPTFASTHQTDRITFFQTQYASPIYAVNNFPGYENEAKDKQNTAFPAPYIDEIWNQRMITEKFDVWPEQEPDKVLPNWVSAIVFGFIKYDETRKQYTIESEEGDILEGNIFLLGERRDTAFEQFRLQGMSEEVDNRIQEIITEKGRPYVEDIIRAAKHDWKNYMSSKAQLSKVELDRVQAKDPAYNMVIDQLKKEVEFLKDLDI